MSEEFVTITLPDGRKAKLPKSMSRQEMAAALNSFPQEPSGGGEQSAPIGADMSIMGRIKDNVMGVDDGVMSFGEKVGTFLNKGGESMTFGLVGDEASAAVAGAIPGGMDYDERLAFERGNEAQLERENPGAALTAEIGGGVLGAFLPGGAIGTLGRGAGLMPRLAASTAAGAGMGGTYGFMEGEGQEGRLEDAQTGAQFGAALGFAAPAIGAGVQKIADGVVGNRAIRQAAQNAPDSATLRRMGNELYDQVDNAGVQVKGEAFNDARQRIVEALQSNTAYTPRPGGRTITPNTSAVVGNMADMADDMAGANSPGLPFKEIDSLRRQAGAAAGNVTNKSDQQAGMTIIEGLDDFVKGLGDGDVVAGDVKALQDALPKAREVWSRMSKSQLLDDAIEQQGNYRSGGASAISNRFASILRNPKTSRAFTDAEKKAMQRVVSGSIPNQIVNYLGSGLGMMGQMGLGAATGGPGGFALGMAGAAASRKAAESMTLKNADIARALVANGRLNTLPVASDSVRKISEALMRRGSTVGPQ